MEKDDVERLKDQVELAVRIYRTCNSVESLMTLWMKRRLRLGNPGVDAELLGLRNDLEGVIRDLDVFSRMKKQSG